MRPDRRSSLIERLLHLVKDVQATLLRLIQRDLHDFPVNAGDLDVHLQRRYAIGGAGDLEVHIAKMILVAEDVGKHGEVVVLLDEAHRDARDRVLERDARVHHRQRRAADRRHRR